MSESLISPTSEPEWAAFAAIDYAGRRVGVLESTVVLNSGDDGRLGPIVAIEVECEIVDIG